MADKNSLINPSSGLYSRNPTHVTEADNADDQSDIVKAIRDTGTKRMRVQYDYSSPDPKNQLPLMGIRRIREMSEESIIKFCQSLMRTRPNIFKVHIKLGNYPNAKRIDNVKVRQLNANKPRFHTEVGEKMGEVLSDRNMNVVEIKYNVNNAETGYFSATAEVYGTTMEEYTNDDYFAPVIEFEFIKTT